jgi:two-component system sensor histidine kinase PrrB
VVEADEDIGSIEGWPGGLRLAVDNLVRNAITHGEASRIVLAAHRTPGPMNPESERRGPDVLTIVVDDNGRGLPADEHEAVMGRFARGSTAVPGGSGLGLALVAQQAELHGGGIELSNSPLGGLRATLTVATSHEPEPDSALESTVSGDSGSLRRRASRVAGWRSPLKRPPRS